MTLIGVNRWRERASPLPPNNRQKSGDLNRFVTDTGEEIGLYAEIFGESNNIPQHMEFTGDEIHSGPPYTVGGPFINMKVDLPQFVVQGSGHYKFHNSYLPPSWSWRYDGGFYDPLWFSFLDTVPDSNYLLPTGLSDSTLFPELSSLGSRAYARLRPATSEAGFAVALAESKDLPRMLSGSAKGFSDIWKTLGGNLKRNPMQPKKAADHFINHQFGWKPFLSDLQKFQAAHQKTAAYMAQRFRDNNQWVRRKRVDRRIESESIIYSRTDITGVQPETGIFTNMIVGPRSYTITLQEFTDVWYEGVFKVYLPEFDPGVGWSNSKFGEAMREMSLYGAHVNPTVLWKKTAWTWLIDWYTNAGDLIQQAEDWATNKVVSKYMYLMHHHRRRFELRSKFTTCDGQNHDLIWYRSADIKRREAASTRFEWNLGTGLNGVQIAILAALGLSRKPS